MKGLGHTWVFTAHILRLIAPHGSYAPNATSEVSRKSKIPSASMPIQAMSYVGPGALQLQALAAAAAHIAEPAVRTHQPFMVQFMNT